jgi:hypothetical protein
LLDRSDSYSKAIATQKRRVISGRCRSIESGVYSTILHFTSLVAPARLGLARNTRTDNRIPIVAYGTRSTIVRCETKLTQILRPTCETRRTLRITLFFSENIASTSKLIILLCSNPFPSSQPTHIESGRPHAQETHTRNIHTGTTRTQQLRSPDRSGISTIQLPTKWKTSPSTKNFGS